jgi:hypothetical protein
LSKITNFEVALYNKEVRRLVEDGSRHRHLTDDWAETHYIVVSASDEHEARIKIGAKYPEHNGFVIEQVVPAQDDH